MINKKDVSRRNFIKQSSLGLGAGIVGVSTPYTRTADLTGNKKLPREISIATVDLKGLWPDDTREARIRKVLERMDEIAGLQPDIVCLPELFDTMWVEEKKHLRELAEDEKVPGPVTSRIAAFAKKNNCYVVCPMYTKTNGNFYNSSILLDRKGGIVGVYHKTHPTKPETSPDPLGYVMAGAIDQPVFQTDFGKVGMQICYDANWQDGWDNLKKKGAELVLFSSAFPGGRILNYYALKNEYYIMSSTGGDARVIDISGNDLDSTSEFIRYAWATINLEKVSVTTWPTNHELAGLFKKYGEQLRIKTWGNTEVVTIESRDPELKVLDALKEFKIPTYASLLKDETEIQNKYRLRK